jgi:hypothetical protein
MRFRFLEKIFPLNASAGRQRDAWLAGVAFLIVAWFTHYTVRTAGGLKEGTGFDYYNLLVDGFRQGHLFLPVEPDSRLVALPDPYDPGANAPYRLPDASYYRGSFYIYFGPTPVVVLMLPYAILTGQHLTPGAAAMVFVLVGVAAGSATWLAARRRYFPASATWLAPAGVLLFGLGTHVMAVARRPQIWELPIAASFAFVMLAVAAAYRAIHGRHPVAAMAAAGLCLGLAVGARPPALFASVMLVPVLWHLRRQGATSRNWLQAGAAAALMMGLCGLALMAYNYARFDSPVEFGQSYQLTGIREGSARHFSPAYFFHNLWLYFFWPVEWTPDWPFLAARSFPPGPPGYYGEEELYCLAWLCPFLWLVPAGWLARPAGGAPASWRVFLATLTAAALAMTCFVLCFFSATERYMVDFVPLLMLLALGGALVLEQLVAARRGRPYLHAGLAGLALVTVTAGILASFDYHGRSMRQSAPEEWRRWRMRVDAAKVWLGVSEPWVEPVLTGTPGGTLCLRLQLPRAITAEGQPLVVLGSKGLADIVGLRQVGQDRWVFFIDHWATPLRETPAIALASVREHRVEITLPSFAADNFGGAARGEASIRVDGQEIWREVVDAYGFAPGSVDLGRNEVRATTCTVRFAGSLAEAHWRPEPALR